MRRNNFLRKKWHPWKSTKIKLLAFLPENKIQSNFSVKYKGSIFLFASNKKGTEEHNDFRPTII